MFVVGASSGRFPGWARRSCCACCCSSAPWTCAAELHVYDLKGTGDLAPLRPVAHRYRAGDDPEDIEYLVADYRWLRDEMRRRTKMIREIADKYPERCPENKVTPELASDPRLRLHPIAVAIDGPRVAFEHPAYGAEMATIATDLAKRGPALGMHADARHPAARRQVHPDRDQSANVVLRFCLKVIGQLENDMILGTSAVQGRASGPPCSPSRTRVSSTSAARACAPRIMRGQNIDGPDREGHRRPRPGDARGGRADHRLRARRGRRPRRSARSPPTC